MIDVHLFFGAWTPALARTLAGAPHCRHAVLVRRFLLLIPLVLALQAAPAHAVGPAPVPLPDDATIAVVPGGGLYRGAARAEIERQVGARYERPVHVRVKSRHVKLPTARLGQTIRYGQMLDMAYDLARAGKPVS